MTAIARAISTFTDEDGFRMDELLSPDDIRKLAELIREHINHEGE